MIVKRPAGQRIYVSAKIDHLSIEADEWLPACGQKSKFPFRPTGNSFYPSVKLCTRCEELASASRAR